MKLSRKQISYGVVLTIAMVALGYDRLFNSAKPIPVPPVPAAATAIAQIKSVQPAAANDLSATVNIARRLRAISSATTQTGAERDAFAAPTSWLDTGSTNPGTPGDARTAALTAQFIQAHQLRMIYREGTISRVIVNDRLVKAGDTIDGFVFIGTDGRTARFRNGSSVATLSITGPDSNGADGTN